MFKEKSHPGIHHGYVTAICCMGFLKFFPCKTGNILPIAINGLYNLTVIIRPVFFSIIRGSIPWFMRVPGINI